MRLAARCVRWSTISVSPVAVGPDTPSSLHRFKGTQLGLEIWGFWKNPPWRIFDHDVPPPLQPLITI